jgi:hypothetical protein
MIYDIFHSYLPLRATKYIAVVICREAKVAQEPSSSARCFSLEFVQASKSQMNFSPSAALDPAWESPSHHSVATFNILTQYLWKTNI